MIKEMEGFPGASEGKTWPSNAEIQVWSLILEDPTCSRVTNPLVPQLLSLCSGAQEIQPLDLCAAAAETGMP